MTSSAPAAASAVDVRPFFEEVAEIGLDRLDRRLLQHDLRQPDAVRVGPHAARKSRRRHRARAGRDGARRTRRAAARRSCRPAAGVALAGWLAVMPLILGDRAR